MFIFVTISVVSVTLSQDTWEKNKEHMTHDHEEIKKEFYVESGFIAVESCCICELVFFIAQKTLRNIHK